VNNIINIFYRFFFLGLISFGGPIAHLAYFRKTFVEKLKWLKEEDYSKFVALSHFLPGPSSSQVGFCIGLEKGGLLGGITAFIAFTFPSFILLYILALFNISQNENILITNIITGLKLFALVIVLDAIITMFKNFCKNKTTQFIFILSTLVLIAFSSLYVQVIVLITAAILSSIFLNEREKEQTLARKKINSLPFILFLMFFFLLPFFTYLNNEIKLFSDFFSAGSMVFGGGHVVLPLLKEHLSHVISDENFLLAYSFSQAIPGPMFSIASYLGANYFKESAFLGSLLAALAIFLPGFLLILTFKESFQSISKQKNILNAIAGINAAVVSLLTALMITTVYPSAVHSSSDLIQALLGLIVLRVFKIPILYMIGLFILFAVFF